MNASLEYFPTDLTTVTLNASREIFDTAVPGVAGAYASGGDLTIEHELFRPIILIGSVAYRSDDFRGIDRRDEIFRASVGFDYAFRREVVFNVRYIYQDIDSNGLNQRAPFTDNVVRVGIELRR